MARITFPDVELGEDEQEHLFALIHKGSHSARVITRAHLVQARQGPYPSRDLLGFGGDAANSFEDPKAFCRRRS